MQNVTEKHNADDQSTHSFVKKKTGNVLKMENSVCPTGY